MQKVLGKACVIIISLNMYLSWST